MTPEARRNWAVVRERHLQHRIDSIKLLLLLRGHLMSKHIEAATAENARLRAEAIAHKTHREPVETCSTCRCNKALGIPQKGPSR